MQDKNEFDQSYANEQLRRSEHPLRKLIKYFYINNLLTDVNKGPTVDIGCGAGQLLAKLPQGSLGLELNPFLVEALTAKGLNVKTYDLVKDDFRLSNIAKHQFQTLTISHVLEHFANADIVMQKLFTAAADIGISRIIIVVPGKLGYESDSTHRTYINNAYIQTNKLENVSVYKLARYAYFPLPNENFGDYFIYQELKLIYDKQ